MSLKLEWYEDTEEVCNFTDDPDMSEWEDQKVMKSYYNGFSLTVFKVRDQFGGYEYEILYPEEQEGEKYDSMFDSYMGGDTHARTQKEAMKWAENTLQNILEEVKPIEV